MPRVARKWILVAMASAVLARGVALGQEQELVRQAQHARELMAQGKFAEAAPIYRELVKALPDETGLLLNLALAEHMAGQPRQAIPHFQAVLKKQPGSVPALVSLAACELEVNQPRLAIEPLRKAVAAEPLNLDARNMLADTLLDVERYDQAAEQYRALAKMAPGDARAWFGLGKSCEALAGRAFEQLARSAPQSAYMAALDADVRLQRRQYRAAVELYRDALAREPSLHGAHAGLAEAYRRANHADWAAAEEAREKSLPAPDCAAQRVECRFAAGQYAEAAAAAERERTPAALYWGIKAYNELSRDAYSRLGGLPESPQMHAVKAAILRDQGRHAESAGEWREALRLAPREPRYREELATSLYLAGDYKSALAEIEQCLKRDPDSPQLNLLEGDSLLHLEEVERAIGYLEKAARRDPKLLGAHASLGLAYARAGRSKEAVPHLEAALPADRDGSLHYQLARAYQAAGLAAKAAQAMAQYQEIVRKAEAEKAQEAAEIPPPR